jgi:hypothetical protein
MKIVGYVIFGMGCLLFVVYTLAFNSGPANVVNHILIVGLCILIVGIVLVSIATIREQAAERAYRKAHPEPKWVSWNDLFTGEAQVASKDRIARPERDDE